MSIELKPVKQKAKEREFEKKYGVDVSDGYVSMDDGPAISMAEYAALAVDADQLIADYEHGCWLGKCQDLAAKISVVHWEIADHILEGETWKEGQGNPAFKYAIRKAAAAIFGVNTDVIKDWVYVARNVKADVRVPELSFTHHRIVAPLSPEKQAYYLSQMEGENVNQAKERVRIHEGKHAPTPPADPPTNYIDDIIACCKALTDRIQAAKSAGEFEFCPDVLVSPLKDVDLLIVSVLPEDSSETKAN